MVFELGRGGRSLALVAVVSAGFASEADAATIWEAAQELLSSTYTRAPALVWGLALLLALPLLATVGLARRRVSSAEAAQATQIYRRSNREDRSAVVAQPDERPLWPSDAWIELPGGERHSVGGIVRLGRDADNDICLEDKTVHRYHAAIHRTDDAAFVITDLSAGGNGVVVNGGRTREAQLRNGDVIELGQTKLNFVSRPA